MTSTASARLILTLLVSLAVAATIATSLYFDLHAPPTPTLAPVTLSAHGWTMLAAELPYPFRGYREAIVGCEVAPCVMTIVLEGRNTYDTPWTPLLTITNPGFPPVRYGGPSLLWMRWRISSRASGSAFLQGPISEE